MSRRPTRRVVALVAATAVISLAGGSASAVTFDFNAPGDFTNNFNTAGTANTFVETDAIGAAGTRAIDVVGTGGDASATNRTQSFDFSILNTRLVVSALYKPENTGTVAQRILDVGILSSDTSFFSQAGGQAGVSLDRQGTSPVDLLLRTRVDNASPGSPVSAGFTVDPTHFYLLTADLRNAGGGMAELNASLVDFGTTGQTPGDTVATLTSTFTTTLASDPTVFGGFRTRAANAISAVDNFSIDLIPEPAGVGLALTATLPGLLLRRRRQA